MSTELQSTRRRTGGVLATAFTTLLVLCTGALGAGSGRAYTLNVGDYARVMDSGGFAGVICYRSRTARPVASVECYLSASEGVKPLSYSGFVTADSTSIWRYDAQQKAHLVWRASNRSSGADSSPRGGDGMLRKGTREVQTASRESTFGKGYTMGIGDSAAIPGSPVHCFNDPSAQPHSAVECYVHDTGTRSGIQPGSYMVILDTHDITVWKYGAGGDPVRVFAHLQPQG
jgi:hypothetical protein